MPSIPKLIRFLRSTKSWTQEGLSERVGIDYRHYQKIEAGQVSIRLETIEKIADTFDLSLREFFKVHDFIHLLGPYKQNSNPEVAQSLLHLFLGAHTQKLPPEIFKSVSRCDEILRHGRIKEGNRDCPLLQMKPDGHIIWWNKPARLLFSGTCVEEGNIPLLGESCSACDFNCCRQTDIRAYDNGLFQQILSREQSPSLFVWGHQRADDLLYLTCIQFSQDS